MNDPSNPDRELNRIALLLFTFAVMLLFTGLSLVAIAAKHLSHIGDSLLVETDAVKQQFHSLQRIGGIALPLIAVSLGVCGVMIRRTVRKRQG